MIQFVRVFSISSLIFMGSCTLSVATAEAATTGDKEAVQTQEVYKIRVGAYKNVNNAKVTNLGDLGGTIYTEETGTGITRVLLGDYATKDDADDILDEVHERGYDDAYIVSGKAVAALVAPATHAVTTPTAVVTPAPVVKSVDTPAAKPAEKIADAGTVVTAGAAYLVQIGSFKKPDYERQLSEIGDYGSLYTTIKKAKNTKVFLGVYESQEDADKVLKLVQTSGYKGAFIKTTEFILVNDQFKPVD